MNAAVREMEVSRNALWLGLFGGAAAWTVHLMLAYGIAEFGCVAGIGERIYLGLSLVAWLEIALTVVTTLASGAAALVAYRSHQRLRSTDDREDSEAYLAWAGVLTSGIFTLVIVFESIPILYYLQSC
jgi:hypothetical protein